MKKKVSKQRDISQVQAQAQPEDPATARKLERGLTLVPCWGRSEDGRRIPYSAWVLLRPGESISDAAHRLTKQVCG